MESITFNKKFNWFEVVVYKGGIEIYFYANGLDFFVVFTSNEFDIEVVYKNKLEYKSSFKFMSNRWFDQTTGFEIDIDGLQINYDKERLILKIFSADFEVKIKSYYSRATLNIYK